MPHMKWTEVLWLEGKEVSERESNWTSVKSECPMLLTYVVKVEKKIGVRLQPKKRY